MGRSSSRETVSAAAMSGLKMSGASIQVRQREAFEMMAARVKVLEKKSAAQADYIRVLERDTELLRTGAVVPKHVVDSLEEHFAHFEVEAKRVHIEEELAVLRDAVETAASARPRRGGEPAAPDRRSAAVGLPGRAAALPAPTSGDSTVESDAEMTAAPRVIRLQMHATPAQ